MQSIYQPTFSNLLPPSLTYDEKFVALAKALDVQLERLSGEIKNALHLPRLDDLSGRVLDLLAWQFHVDNYQPFGLSDDIKRNLIRNSIAYHRRKGTRAAVNDVCAAFGNKIALEEWFEVDDLEPYWFRLSAQIKDATDIDTFIKRIWDAKNVRSHMVLRLKKQTDFKAYAGIAHHRWGRKRILMRDVVTSEPKKTIDTLGERVFIIEPNKVTVRRGGDEEIITPTLPSDKLKLKFAFPSGSRTITINNPRQDLTADDINAVADYAVSHDLLLKIDDAADDLTSAKLISIVKILLDIKEES